MHIDLSKQVAIVTGAGQGIGRAIALALAQAGAKVVVSDLKAETAQAVAKDIQQSGGESLAVTADVSQPAELNNLFKTSLATFGAINILVNNAGIFPFQAWADISSEDWDRVLNINLKGLFFASQAAAKNMPTGGRIINISSIAGQVAFSGLTHYCASKGGVDSLTRVLALELAATGITVNAIAPGAIDTPGANQGANEEAKQQMLAAIPAGRMGQAEEIAAAAVFLASSAAAYITGQVLVVDGGWTLR